MREVLLGQKVGIVTLDLDRWDRTVGGVVRLADGESLQDLLMDEGLAWVDPRYCKGCTQWKAKQKKAIAHRRGIWGDTAPAAPWQWRADKRKLAEERGGQHKKR